MGLVNLIAALCMLKADSSVHHVEYRQRNCHAFYAECTKKKNIRDCMIKREKDSLKKGFNL